MCCARIVDHDTTLRNFFGDGAVALTGTPAKPAAERVAVGSRAPDFALPDSTGRTVRLSDLLGHGPIVLYFYPKDNTRGCTAEACAFRDSYEVFRAAGAKWSASVRTAGRRTRRLPNGTRCRLSC